MTYHIKTINFHSKDNCIIMTDTATKDLSPIIKFQSPTSFQLPVETEKETKDGPSTATSLPPSTKAAEDTSSLCSKETEEDSSTTNLQSSTKDDSSSGLTSTCKWLDCVSSYT